MVRMEDDYIDIHDYKRMHKTAIENVKKCLISERNRELILKFDETLGLIDRVGLARRTRVLGYLSVFAKEYLKMDFDKATREDIKRAVSLIDGRSDYSPWTKQGYRVIIKKFYRWLKYGDSYNEADKKKDYPSKVSWISCHIKSKDLPKVSASDILTELEIVKLLDAASDDKRNEAIIGTLYEDGCRIGEHGSVRLKHVKKEGDCYILTVRGKTGIRETFIVKLAKILTDWLNIHPYKDDPQAPLWIVHGTMNPLKHHSFISLVKRVAKKAGITKRIYPHIFRHSRVTHGIVSGEFTMEGAKKVFGWCPDTKMLETYLHITSKDVKDKYLERLGLKAKRESSPLNPKVCPRCKHPNLFNASICETCQALLENDIAIEKDERMVAMRKFIAALCQDNYIAFRVEQMAKEEKSFLDVVELIGKN